MESAEVAHSTTIVEHGSEYEILRFDIGRTNEQGSHLTLKLTAATDERLQDLLSKLSVFGCYVKGTPEATLRSADMDGAAPYENTGNAPFVGPTITELVQKQLSSGQPTLGWDIKSGDEFNNDVLEVRQAVYNFDAWAAIIINPNASALLYEAVATGNTSYDPLGACQLVYQDARDDTNWYDFMLPIISQFMTQATSKVGQQWAKMALQNASDPTILANIQAAPQAISPAIGFSEFNLRPFYPYTAIPAVSIGLICKLHAIQTSPTF